MSHERFPAPAPLQEQGEKKDAQQERVDITFEKAALNRYSEQYDDDRMFEATRLMLTLLEQPVSGRLGEPYTLEEERDGFAVASRQQRDAQKTFDPKAQLGVFWGTEINLAEGRIRIEYDVHEPSAPKHREGWRASDFDKTLIKQESAEFKASQEVTDRIYDVLELEFRKKQQAYEQNETAYEALLAAAKKNDQRRLGEHEWNLYAILEKGYGGPFDEWELSLDSKGDIIVTAYSNSQLYDIYTIKKPTPPAREYPPRQGQ